MPRKQLANRLVYGVFVLGIAAFVISNIVQVAAVLFGERPAAGLKVEPACAAAVEEQTRAIAEAIGSAASEVDPEHARSRYAALREGSAAKLDAACGSSGPALEAKAALARLDRASESHAVRLVADLHPVRDATMSFIRRSP